MDDCHFGHKQKFPQKNKTMGAIHLLGLFYYPYKNVLKKKN
jgi:hypothetical protein